MATAIATLDPGSLVQADGVRSPPFVDWEPGLTASGSATASLERC